MVTMTGNEEHRNRKRMLSRPYSNSYILSSPTLDSVLSRVSRRLGEEVAEWARTGLSVDVYQRAKCCTLDVAFGWLFGSENATDTLRDPGFEHDLSALASSALKRLSLRTSAHWSITYLASLIDNGLPDREAKGRWEAWLTRVITDSYRRHPTKPPSAPSLYDHFYDAFKAANPDMPRNDAASHIAVECDDHLSASHTSVGTVLAYTMYELSRDPHWQNALRKELLTGYSIWIWRYFGARGQQGHAVDAAVAPGQADDSRRPWNSTHKGQGPPGRIASRDFGLEEGDTVTAARPYYPAKASG